MNVNTGQVFESYDDAMRAGEKPEDIVEIIGTEEQVRQVSDAVKARNRAKNKAARKSRKRNR